MSTTAAKSSPKPHAGKAKPSVKRKLPFNAKQRAYARFDARLPHEIKVLFETAASIKGFKSLSEFVIHYTSEAANSIIEKHKQVLSSERDRSIFFDALLNPQAPNDALVRAARRHKIQVANK